MAGHEYRRQWGQLLVLTTVHFVADSFPGLMHTVLPAFQESFQLSVAAGAVLLTVFLVAANAIQVLIGHLRPEEEKPLFLYLGMVLMCVILLFGTVSPERMPLLWLSLISLCCGIGVGMTHPEALKAIHRLDGISSVVSSSVFMAGGVMGFAFSGWISTHLYQWLGVGFLVPFCAASILVMFGMMMFRIRLAVERDEPARRAKQGPSEPVSFWLIMAIATLGACSSQTLCWIVPQRISEMGAELTLGGLAVSVFSLAGGIGGIVMSRRAHRFGEMVLIRRMLMAGIPFIVAYLFWIENRWAVAVLFVGSFFCFGAYPIMVSAARHSEGLNLGRRMGLIVGGIWLVACLLPMLLGPIASRFGTAPILFCVPMGFILSLGLSKRYD
jgi:FSR family fosmidomycin resistance protein-like MFS transporter